MKITTLDNIISEKELYFIYYEALKTYGWQVNCVSSNKKETNLNYGPILTAKFPNEPPHNYALWMYGQTLVHRINKMLEEKHIGIPTELNRMWFTCTYSGKKSQHWLHQDSEKSEYTSILMFMTPLWQPDWRGSFYVDGQEIKFKPGSAVIFNSTEYHQGESPISETYNWQRITLNMMVKENNKQYDQA